MTDEADLRLDDASFASVEQDQGGRVEIEFNYAGGPFVVSLPLAVARQLEVALRDAGVRRRGGGGDVIPFAP